ncbi:hypothetical protein FB45DRAFT_1064974 [Roridomyces roridus]|uniref:F-box domain-containing protein n=1 Tax=Roridomyces roridus TaxID=1738132 RepID=A0AAD7B8T5_9AGAR|nr:hypothetical protein FB45DRAFT_1064974 [Roridomyces roridus]
MVLTRRAHRARMVITLWLPNEVLTEIIRCPKKPDQATLCRVSKLFHGLVLPILNRAILLDTLDKNGSPCQRNYNSFLQSLIRNPERAEAVRSLTFLRKWPYPPPVDYDFLFESMALMRNLEFLSFDDILNSKIITRLASLTWPNLSWCRIVVVYINVSTATSFAKFLSQHPAIVRVFLWTLGARDSLGPGPTFLPDLRHFSGEGIFLDRLSTRSLEAARVQVDGSRIDRDAQALQAASHPNLPFVLSLEFASLELENPIQTILRPLSADFPGIRSLQLREIETNLLGITALQHVTAHMPYFTQIAYFSLTYDTPQPEFAVDAESDDAAFQTSVAASPTLIGCCIGNVARRKVGEEWERLSVDDFDEQAGFSVFEPSFQD